MDNSLESIKERTAKSIEESGYKRIADNLFEGKYYYGLMDYNNFYVRAHLQQDNTYLYLIYFQSDYYSKDKYNMTDNKNIDFDKTASDDSLKTNPVKSNEKVSKEELRKRNAAEPDMSVQNAQD